MATNIKKNSTADTGKFSYKYVDLAAINEELEKQGITYYQYTAYDVDAKADYVYTVLKIGDETMQAIRGAKIIEDKTLVSGNACQQYGSALSYCRRYSLLMALGWAAEDDDGASSGKPVSAKAAPSQSTAKKSYDGGRLDFDKLKSYLSTLDSAGKVLGAKAAILSKHPNITEKQKNAVEKIFKERLESFEVEMTEFSDDEIPEV